LREGHDAIDERVAELLRTVGLLPDDAKRFCTSFPVGSDSHIDRSRAGKRAGISRLRRTNIGARRFCSGAGPQSYA